MKFILFTLTLPLFAAPKSDEYDCGGSLDPPRACCDEDKYFLWDLKKERCVSRPAGFVFNNDWSGWDDDIGDDYIYKICEYIPGEGTRLITKCRCTNRVICRRYGPRMLRH